MKLKPRGRPDGEHLTVHAELLCHFSPYYRVAIEGEFQEKGKDFFDVDAGRKALRMATTWMYTGKIVNIGDEDKHPSVPALIALYVFADSYNFLALRRDLMSSLADMYRGKVPLYQEVTSAYDSLPSNSPLCRRMVACYVFHWSIGDDEESQEEEDRDSAPSTFLSAVMAGREMQRDRNSNRKHNTECDCCVYVCEYHEHESDEEWHASEFALHQHVTNADGSKACGRNGEQDG